MLFRVPLQKSHRKKDYMPILAYLHFSLLNPQFHPIFWDTKSSVLPENIIDLTSQDFSSGSFKNPSWFVITVLYTTQKYRGGSQFCRDLDLPLKPTSIKVIYGYFRHSWKSVFVLLVSHWSIVHPLQNRSITMVNLRYLASNLIFSWIIHFIPLLAD